MKIYGIEIKADLTCPINSWHFESQEMQDLAKLVLKLETYLKCKMLNLRSIEVVSDQACCEFNRDGWRMNWRPGQVAGICEKCLKNETKPKPTHTHRGVCECGVLIVI